MEHIDNGLFIKQERFEVLAILRDIYKQKTPLRVANQQHQFSSQLLSVGADNIVFECDANNERFPSGEFNIVIESQDAKIEFALEQAELTEHNDMTVYAARLPEKLVYIQRRRQLRITTPYWREFLCRGEYDDGTPYQLRIHDLSPGGVGLRIDSPVPTCMQPGLVFNKAQLDLGDYGKFTVNMELIAINEDHEVDEDEAQHFSRLSCRFIKLGIQTERKIQSAVFAFELDFNKKKKR
ncbi:c-di-GMP-binding flagellar brake protein YcgR [Serratia fonticola]|uniref:Flagellar brake protein YcgR n=1 Tax=Serratia fonticola TaxID=47917 RepID=A0A542BPS2_SERFO|nr:flagellar brake protein [Serratia fonticola]TQI80586.1 c-di-GMP-binding flagellar brake protein YcgR [Serratia fonticola]TQI97389.1 c-di-GMP-binding flagellar brake protein YcgR [Serratia fonticola]TVZ71885.1 c-di-GMP-binding flagellar brake protein YcgR [Serratia fonticola]